MPPIWAATDCFDKRGVGLFKDSKWSKEIISLQKPNGMWGHFHSLSEPNKKSPITTEQALRRLSILGYDIEDGCIAKAVAYMSDCLSDKTLIPERPEKLHNWDIFTDLMLATWIRRFTKDNDSANKIAGKWASLITSAFDKGTYNHVVYESSYFDIFGMKPKGGRLVDFVTFYQVSLISDCLDENIEATLFDYIMNHESGIYYICNGPLTALPDSFMSKQACAYIAAMELIVSYRRNRHKLHFVADWLNLNKSANGMWDMGAVAKNYIHFPLSDDWRNRRIRESDCSYRIQKLVDKIMEVSE